MVGVVGQKYGQKVILFLDERKGRVFDRPVQGVRRDGGKDGQGVLAHRPGVSEKISLRGAEGAYLLNNCGKRFMKDYAPSTMELAPRDVVARAIQTEINEGRGLEGGYVHLDLRHLGQRIKNGTDISLLIHIVLLNLQQKTYVYVMKILIKRQ